MKLERTPETTSEAEHIETAIGWTTKFFSEALPAPDDKDSLCEFQAHPPTWIEKCHERLTSNALLGWAEAQDLLSAYATYVRTIENQPLPLWLQDYAVKVISNRGKLRRRRGRRQAVTQRNWTIADGVKSTVELFGFCPTRNLAKRPGKKAGLKASGCSIVAEALGRLGIHMSEANVVACWRKHGHLIRPTN